MTKSMLRIVACIQAKLINSVLTRFISKSEKNLHYLINSISYMYMFSVVQNLSERKKRSKINYSLQAGDRKSTPEKQQGAIDYMNYVSNSKQSPPYASSRPAMTLPANLSRNVSLLALMREGLSSAAPLISWRISEDYPRARTQGTARTILSCMVMEAGNRQRAALTAGAVRAGWI